jgi:hypothetical protein
MIGIVRKCAHIGGADIEQMTGIGGAIGDAAADFVPLLHERDAHAAGWIAEKMTGEQNAAGAAADDDYMRFKRWSHLVFPQLAVARARCPARLGDDDAGCMNSRADVAHIESKTLN